jgi:hypothetical protein
MFPRLAVVLALCALSPTAFAETNRAVPMIAIASSAEACVQLSAGIDKAKCTSAKRETLASVGDVELWVARGTDKVRYAVTIASAGKVYMSAPTELVVSDVCTDRGSERCTWLVTDAAKLRALHTAVVGELATFELATHYKHLSTGGKTPPVQTFYDGYDVVACGKISESPKQDLICRARHWGGTRASSCKGTLADNGGVELACHAQEAVTILDM